MKLALRICVYGVAQSPIVLTPFYMRKVLGFFCWIVFCNYSVLGTWSALLRAALQRQKERGVELTKTNSRGTGQ